MILIFRFWRSNEFLLLQYPWRIKNDDFAKDGWSFSSLDGESDCRRYREEILQLCENYGIECIEHPSK